MKVLLVSCDLVIASQMRGVVPGQDNLEVAGDAQAAGDACRASLPQTVLIDLALPGLNVARLVADLRSVDNPPGDIIAFGPHVHTARLQAAREAGCDRVTSRGEILSHMQQIFSSAQQ